jgi:zinc transporter 9
VLLEDAVALLGIVLTLIVAGSAYAFGPHPEFDASIAIVVGLLLGAMAIFLAALNRRLLIDTSDLGIDRAAERWLASHGIGARVHSLILDDDSVVVFVESRAPVERSSEIGDALKAHLQSTQDKVANDVYWKISRTAAARS